MNQFQIGNKHYILMQDEQIAEFKFSKLVEQSALGEKLSAITTSVDSSLIGSDVYKYLPAGGEAIVAVKKDNEYTLFRFFAFDSYNNNQDEDANTYLKLYGINSEADIAKIQFIGHSEQSKIEGVLDIKGEITEPADIKEFYDFYSMIKNSSEKYFDKLYNYRSKITGEPSSSGQTSPSGQTSSSGETSPSSQPVRAPDEDFALDQPEKAPDEDFPATDLPDATTTNKTEYAEDLPAKATAETGAGTSVDTGGSTDPSQGNAGNALYDSITIRIYNQRGVYFDAEYYPNIGFISRHEVTNKFATFLKGYID